MKLDEIRMPIVDDCSDSYESYRNELSDELFKWFYSRFIWPIGDQGNRLNEIILDEIRK